MSTVGKGGNVRKTKNQRIKELERKVEELEQKLAAHESLCHPTWIWRDGVWTWRYHWWDNYTWYPWYPNSGTISIDNTAKTIVAGTYDPEHSASTDACDWDSWAQAYSVH
jgi:hypothetical protein